MNSTISDLQSIKLIEVEMPLVHPFQTSFGVQKNKHAILVKITDTEGNTGWGETTVMKTPSYCSETTETAWHIQTQFLIPSLRELNQSGEFSIQQLLEEWHPVRGNQFPKGGIEASLWALLAEQQQVSLGKLYGITKEKIPTGVSIGIQKDKESLIQRISDFVDRGYQRIKMKIKPGWDIEIIENIRNEFPNLDLMVDANSAYTLNDVDIFQKLDQYNLMMIEQPLAYNDVLAHKQLQDHIKTPVCLDESIHDPKTAKYAMEFGSCEIINIKPGRVGGFANAIEIAKIGGEGAVWCGGMLETGIGRLHNVFLQARSEFNIPGDTSGSDRYFANDIIDPKVEVDNDGFITVPSDPGLGATILEDQINEYTTRQIEIEL